MAIDTVPKFRVEQAGRGNPGIVIRGKRMRAFCNREGLLTAFAMVSGVVPVRSPKPILQNVKLIADAEEGSVLMGTDLEVGIRHRVLGVRSGSSPAP